MKSFYDAINPYFYPSNSMRLLLFLIPYLCLIHATLAPAASIIDSDNKTLIFSQPFKRIISLYPAHTTNLLALGLNKEILATGHGDNQIPGRPRLQFQGDPERLLALKPDLVLIRPMISRGYPTLVRILERNNVRVASLQPTKSKELFAYWETLGKLTGREQQAKAMIEKFTAGLATLTASVQHIPQERRKRVYFEAIHRQMKTFASSSIAMFVLESAGGVNIATDALQIRKGNIAAYGKERILAKADQIDLYLAQSGRMNSVSVDDIFTESGFEVIKAVREGQVFLVDETMVSRPTLGLLDGIAFIRSVLYPDYPDYRQDDQDGQGGQNTIKNPRSQKERASL